MGQSEQRKQEQKIVQYLNEAHASEQALVRVLQSQIAMTPRGPYRSALETHLAETRDHAERLSGRLSELDHGSNPVVAAFGVVGTVAGQVLALGKTPYDLVRGSGGEEKVLERVRPLLETEGSRIRHVGPAGAGAATKLANQLMMLSALAGAHEALELASAHGVSEESVLDVVESCTGESWVTRNWDFFDRTSAAYDAGGTLPKDRPWSKDLFEVVQAARAADECIERDGGECGVEFTLRLRERRRHGAVQEVGAGRRRLWRRTWRRRRGAAPRTGRRCRRSR